MQDYASDWALSRYQVRSLTENAMCRQPDASLLKACWQPLDGLVTGCQQAGNGCQQAGIRLATLGC